MTNAERVAKYRNKPKRTDPSELSPTHAPARREEQRAAGVARKDGEGDDRVRSGYRAW